jgi:hypothetical protein
MAMILRNINMVLIALYLLGFDALELQAQPSPFDPEMAQKAALIRDEVSGFTDRSLYITGEAIKFSMRVQNFGLPEERDWSSILYVDLISASGVRQAQGKFRIRKGMATGELRVPEGLLTGVYYLRAYTRWMRNWGPSSYAYLPVKVINPFISELDKVLPNGAEEHALRSLSMQEDGLGISMGSFSHGRGDSVWLELRQLSEDDSQVVNGCLSVVPAVAKPGALFQLSQSEKQEDLFQLDYLPDLFGINISGRLTGNKEDQALGGSRIHFTILGDQPGYGVAHADAYGRFILSLPNREGRLELFVQPEQAGDGTLEVRIDQDFDNRVLPLDLPSFSLDQREEQELVLMARKQQLSGIFLEPGTGEQAEKVLPKVAFYGSPDFSLDLDEYVLLPTLEEVFINLVKDITPIVRRNKTELLIASLNPAISMFPPLLMIDQVPIFSMEQFLSISPRKISHIDLINDVFVRGDMRFGGIINLWSKEGNMAGIDLPEHSFFIDYLALTPNTDVAREGNSATEKLPDTRNTLLWMPDVKLEDQVVRSISLMAPDYPGEYVVIYRGWDEQGRLVSAESRFVVE